ncbi:hypothetical protein E3J39_03295 [Candidatus Bathyarchaeota archaeon]|nr:MAG: hypothetical protein E3J39_03295 [Candidatus Bathyarchaeota archaeon]
MRRVNVEELRKGDLILVRWMDASEIRCSMDEHEGSPEIYCKDWGVYLGVSGRKRRLLLVGKDVVEVHNDWGAARIPLELVDEILLVMPRREVLKAIREIQALGRRVRLRKWRKGEIERVRVV